MSRIETENDKKRKRARYAALKAEGMCVTCVVSRAVKGRVRCYGCLQNRKLYDCLHRVVFSPPGSTLSNAELYKRAKSEREVVSWCWRNPA